ncbi:MAG: ABC transporter substrate-binding protein, partial [Chloroflexota bacterium]
MFRNKPIIMLGMLVVASMILAACAPTQVVQTVIVTEVIEGETVEVIKVVTPTPEPAGPRTLVICQGQEPETLYTYGGAMLAMSHVLEAIFDGPIDSGSFAYQPVILQKLPSLADGDAVIQAVTVAAGDTIVDADLNVATLEEGVKYLPSGCATAECAVEYAGGEVTMDQMVVTFQYLEGLLWSDGTPITTADSLYAFNLASDPDTPVGKYAIQRTASYEALDDITIQWTGLPGYRDSTYFLNIWGPLPEHVWGQYTAA